jgi:hypothetical protein
MEEGADEVRQTHVVLREDGRIVLRPRAAYHGFWTCEILAEHVRAKNEQDAHLGLPRRRGAAPSAPEYEALDPVNIRLLGTAAVMPTVYGLVHLLQQSWFFLTQGFMFCYFKYLTLGKQINTTCAFAQHSDHLDFADSFRRA